MDIMDIEDKKIILFSPQADAVREAVYRDGEAYSRREYVEKKYAECAGIFLTAYDAYVREACKIIPRPEDTAYPYWAFASRGDADLSGGGSLLKLRVPVSEAVFFDRYDWYKVLRLSYVGETETAEKDFARKLEMRGIKDPSEAVLKPFYPDLRREITGSWKRIFRHDGEIRRAIAGQTESPDHSAVLLTEGIPGIRSVQAGLWRIKKEWLI